MEKSSLRAVDATAKHFSAYRESPSCEISRLSTTFGSTTGGSVTRVDARCLAGRDADEHRRESGMPLRHDRADHRVHERRRRREDSVRLPG